MVLGAGLGPRFVLSGTSAKSDEVLCRAPSTSPSARPSIGVAQRNEEVSAAFVGCRNLSREQRADPTTTVWQFRFAPNHCTNMAPEPTLARAERIAMCALHW